MSNTEKKERAFPIFQKILKTQKTESYEASNLFATPCEGKAFA